LLDIVSPPKPCDQNKCIDWCHLLYRDCVDACRTAVGRCKTDCILKTPDIEERVACRKNCEKTDCEKRCYEALRDCLEFCMDTCQP